MPAGNLRVESLAHHPQCDALSLPRPTRHDEHPSGDASHGRRRGYKARHALPCCRASLLGNDDNDDDYTTATTTTTTSSSSSYYHYYDA